MPRSDSPLFTSDTRAATDEEDDNNKFPFFNHTSPQQPRLRRNPTLAELLRRHVDDDVAIELDPMINDIPTRPPFVLSFADLTYSVKLRKSMFFSSKRSTSNNENSNRKVLLRGISGEAREGEITAVMGPSGSGKSTLIDALAHRISKDSLQGTVQLSGRHVDSRLSKAVSGYVMQDDLLFPMLTVQETLMFAAEFRLPRALSRSAKLARVHTLITQLGLAGAAHTVVGDELRRGVSGGERRRVSIGADIIHHPLLLFLDEPTSGLDSTSAFMLVKVLKRIAVAGSVVVMSIHQPSSRIIALLDRLIFLSGGAAVYAGPPSELPTFFCDFGRPIPRDDTADNRTELALDLIRDLDSQTQSSLVRFNAMRQKLEKKPEKTGEEEEETRRVMEERISSLTSMSSSFANPWWAEMAVLARRTVTNSRRMPEEFAVRLGAVVVTGGILATVFWKLDESPKGIEERVGLFAFAMSTTFYTCAEAIPAFLQERYIFMRETAYNTYRRSSYVAAHSLTAVPSLLFLSLTFAAATFWATGLAGGFHLYFLAILASFWAGSSFVTFLSGVVTNVMLGYTVVVAVLAYFLLFSGFFITSDRIPVYWLWFHYLSLVKYPYQAVLRNEFDHSDKCFVRGIQIFDNTPLAAVPEALKGRMLQSMSQTLGLNITPTTCVTTGPDILRQQGVAGLSMWACIGITLAWGFFFRILFYFTLLLGTKNKRT